MRWRSTGDNSSPRSRITPRNGPPRRNSPNPSNQLEHPSPSLKVQTLKYEVQSTKLKEQSYAMVGVNVVAADTDEEARRLFTTVQQSFTNLLRGSPGKLQPPIDDIEEYWTPPEKHQASHMLEHSIVGSPETVRRDLENFVALTKADELTSAASMITPPASGPMRLLLSTPLPANPPIAHVVHSTSFSLRTIGRRLKSL